ncbi:unnamed protein product [Brugia pahangi]|uniref:Zf-3CxxC domain-containing protein n=1 Tax=Brugia pahangi TaxID=6280 RepID=A0A0N4TIP4_BRUPA|nr:unnamed protein product [Brugia pahangi]
MVIWHRYSFLGKRERVDITCKLDSEHFQYFWTGWRPCTKPFKELALEMFVLDELQLQLCEKCSRPHQVRDIRAKASF